MLKREYFGISFLMKIVIILYIQKTLLIIRQGAFQIGLAGFEPTG